jgi:hypothetical protein
MGLDAEEGNEATAQEQYYSIVGFYDRYSGLHPEYAGLAMSMRLAGPPPPEPRDGIAGKLAYYQFHAGAGDAEAARVLEDLRTELKGGEHMRTYRPRRR